MKTIEELIEESIVEIETNKKSKHQVFNEFFQILSNRNAENLEQLNNQRLKEIQNYKQELKDCQTMIKDVLKHFDKMSIDLIKERLNEFISINYRV